MLVWLLASALAEPYEVTQSVWVRSAPDARAPRRGRIEPGAAFEVLGLEEGRGCDSGWHVLELGGFACSAWSVPSDRPPAPPRTVRFDPPEPEEFESYLEHDRYDRAAEGEDVALPFVYGRAYRDRPGPIYASVEAWRSGEPPTGTLPRRAKVHFVDVVSKIGPEPGSEAPPAPAPPPAPTPHLEPQPAPLPEPGWQGPQLPGDPGPSDDLPQDPADPAEPLQGAPPDPAPPEPELGLVRPSGEVVPADAVYLFPVSRFEGRDLRADPVAPGGRAAWVLPYDGLELREAPDTEAASLGHLPFQAALDVFGDGDWLKTTDGAWLRARDVRVFEPGPPLQQAGSDPWIDIDLSQQTLALIEDDEATFVTLISSGLRRTPTPTGLYETFDKLVHNDMRSRPRAREWYHVEEVPWIVHFKPRYALHGVFWHWGLGHPASHGCVNLAPRDARTLFERLSPELPRGWHTVYVDAQHPGSLVRIRGETPRS